MIDKIIACVLGAILVVLSIILYVFITAYLLPRIFIRPCYRSDNICDRGVKKYLFENGRAIVYEPKQSVREYVNQYILSDNSGKRYLQCKLGDSIKKITYRILTFDAYDKALGAFEVTESSIKEQFTQSVKLPYDTAYVSIEIKSINGKKVIGESDIKYSAVKAGGFTALTMFVTVVEAWVIRKFVSFIFGSFLYYTDQTVVGAVDALAIPAIVGIVLSVLVFLAHYSREFKFRK